MATVALASKCSLFLCNLVLCFSAEGGFLRWFKQPSTHFGGKSPLERALSEGFQACEVSFVLVLYIVLLVVHFSGKKLPIVN